jgi:Asp-tRNA(Asn)/Glu-tRNA(Gln) amidotransferase A subunit family amidase
MPGSLMRTLPLSMQIVGRTIAEGTVLRIGAAFESAG